MGSVIGLDISKHSAEVAILDVGTPSCRRRRFAANPAGIRAFADKLGPEDSVALESCTNAFAFHRLLCQHAGRVVVSNPLKTRIIAEAKVKTDKVDAEILARLLAADFLPPVWVPDTFTDQLRHWVSHRQGLVTQRTQAKNRIHAILHRNLVIAEVTDLFGKAGRAFLAEVELPTAERMLLEADLRILDFLETEVLAAEEALAKLVYDDEQVRRLLTIPGIALTSAAGLRAAIGDVSRFRAPANLVSYFGLNPSVYQTGMKAYTGHISRRGRSHARTICVEAAHQLVRVPGPFHAFFQRLRRRKPYNVAITAVARKLTVLVWHMLTKGEDYHYASPDLTREKTNRLHRLATGESAPRRARRTRSEPRHKPGQDAEADYQRFLDDRFGPAGPPVHDHPNQEQMEKKNRKRQKAD
jgi:transposase